jgi:uncharacterized glyoxalase superfamily protein PhnB
MTIDKELQEMIKLPDAIYDAQLQYETVSRLISDRRDWMEGIETGTTLSIAAEQKEDGKAKYTNAEQREAAVKTALADMVIYVDAQNEVKNLRAELQQVSALLNRHRDRMSVLKVYVNYMASVKAE